MDRPRQGRDGDDLLRFVCATLDPGQTLRTKSSILLFDLLFTPTLSPFRL